ncbi:MAG: isochorismatase family protein [Thermoleophilaceae bacterium]
MTSRVLDRDRAALVVVDVQEAFRPAVLDFERVAQNAAVLVQGAQILGLPVVATEQYPKGLGHTVPEVAEHLGGLRPPTPAASRQDTPQILRLEKVCFAATDADGFDLDGRDQAIVCGIESHVCVSQTAHGLLDRGLEVHVARDAVSSRSAENRELGLHKMESAGAVVTSVETALFELLGAAGSDEFKQVQGLVK